MEDGDEILLMNHAVFRVRARVSAQGEANILTEMTEDGQEW